MCISSTGIFLSLEMGRAHHLPAMGVTSSPLSDVNRFRPSSLLVLLFGETYLDLFLSEIS